MHFRSNMARILVQKSKKNSKMTLPRSIKKLIDFWIDSLPILTPFWEPTWSHVGYLFRPKTGQEASKTPPRTTLKMTFKKDPERPPTGEKCPGPFPSSGGVLRKRKLQLKLLRS